MIEVKRPGGLKKEISHLKGDDISDILAVQSSLHDLLSVVMGLGQFGQRSSVILVYNQDTEALELGARWGEVQDASCFHGMVKANACWCERAFERGEIIRPGSSPEKICSAECHCACQSPADVYVPFVTAGRRIGVMGLWVESELSAETLAFLEQMARNLATAVDRARAYDSVRRRGYETMVLNRTGQLITSTLDLDEVLLLIVSEARTVLQAESVWVLLLDQTREELVFGAVAGPDADLIEGIRVPAKTGIAGWVLEAQQPVLVRDAQADPRFYAKIDTERGVVTGSLIAAPISCKGRAIGVIEAVNGATSAFRTYDMELLEVLAGYAAIAIENARLYEAERELRRVTEESQAQLAQSDRLAAIGRMTASLVHELNNPLQALHNSLQVILSFPLDEEEKDTYIQMADEEVARLIDMVNRILEFSRRPVEEKVPVNLNVVTRRVLDLAHKYLQHQHILLDLRLAEELPHVDGNPGRLGQVLLNLVINAVEAMPSGGTLSVMTHGTESDGVLLRVADTGQGIAPEALPHLFEPFFSTKKQGTGLGLSISQNIVAQHGGSISVQSTFGEGTLFEVRLPVSP